MKSNRDLALDLAKKADHDLRMGKRAARGGPESLPANTLRLECHTRLPRLHQLRGRRIEELDADRLSILPVTDDPPARLLHGIHRGIVVKEQH